MTLMMKRTFNTNSYLKKVNQKQFYPIISVKSTLNLPEINKFKNKQDLETSKSVHYLLLRSLNKFYLQNVINKRVIIWG